MSVPATPGPTYTALTPADVTPTPQAAIESATTTGTPSPELLKENVLSDTNPGASCASRNHSARTGRHIVDNRGASTRGV